MTIGTKIVLALIVIHLVLGFGWLMYKLSPRGENHKSQDSDSSEP